MEVKEKRERTEEKIWVFCEKPTGGCGGVLLPVVEKQSSGGAEKKKKWLKGERRSCQILSAFFLISSEERELYTRA